MANDRELTLNELAAVVVASDPELRDEVKVLFREIIGHMRYTMRHGDPASKLALVKTITPQLLGAMKKIDKDEGEAERRAAYNRLMDGLRGDGKVSA